MSHTATVPIHERFRALYSYIYVGEAFDLARCAEENNWSHQECIDNHVLGQAICMAYDLGILEGSPEEEICKVLSDFSNYRHWRKNVH